MPSIQKLKENLQVSQKWGLAFRNQIKELLEQMTQKKNQCFLMVSENNQLRDQISKLSCELKQESDQNKKALYKFNRAQIAIEDIESRIKIYEQSLNKKEFWNQKLNQKLELIQTSIKNSQIQVDEAYANLQKDSFQQEKPSGITLEGWIQQNLNQKFQNQKNQLLKTAHLIEKEILHFQLENKRKQQQLDATKDKQKILNKKLIQQDECIQNFQKNKTKQNEDENKENLINNSKVQETKQQDKQNIEVLQARSDRLTQQLHNKTQWLNETANRLSTLIEMQKINLNYQDDLKQIHRFVRKQQNSLKMIKSYILAPKNN